MSLARKTIGGLFWVSFSVILVKSINFIITIILARLLQPEYFGLVAIALIVINFFDIFRELGIGTALIYKKDNFDMAVNTSFFIFPVVAAIFYGLSYFVAPFAADFFNEPQVENIIKVLSLIFVIWSFGTLPSIILDKNLEFKKKMIPQILPKIGYGIVSVFLALNGYGVWSLVIGRLALELLTLAAFWLIVDWRPSYKFNKSIAFELIKYGKQVVGANILVFLISCVDTAFIGRFLGSEDLGFYSIALAIAGFLTTLVSTVVGRVMFPVYSTIQDDMDTLKKAYARTIKYVSVVSIPFTFVIFTIAQDFIKVVYGYKWLPAVSALQVLCFYTMNRSLLVNNEELYLAVGRPDVRTKLNFLQLIFMSLLIYPLTMQYGILGASIAAMIPSIFILFLSLREAGKIMNESLMYIARPLFPAFAGSILMMVAIWGWLEIASGVGHVFRLAISVMVGAGMYVGYMWWAQREIFYEIKELVGSK